MSAPPVDSSRNWMVEEEDDFEHGACTSFCAGPGQILCKYLIKRKPQSEVDGGKIAEGVLRSDDFDLQQV